MGPGADVAHGRLRRFLHHLAQFAGDGQLALAFHQGAFHGEDLAADFGPGQTGGRADFVLLLGLQVAEFPRPQQLGQAFAPLITDLAAAFCVLAGSLVVDYLAGHLAADVADLALQVAHAGFARVVLDQPVDAGHR